MTNKEAADELKYAIGLIKQNGKDWLDERDIPILKAAISALQTQPEIIRCKDCCFCKLGYDNIGNQYYSCTAKFDESGFWDEVEAKDFCSFAERRTDE